MPQARTPRREKKRATANQPPVYAEGFKDINEARKVVQHLVFLRIPTPKR